MARHLFVLPGFFVETLRVLFPSLLARRFSELPPSPRFAMRTAAAAVTVSFGVSLFVFPLIARTFPIVQLFKKSQKDISPETEPANLDYPEPSTVWYFRSRTHRFFQGLYPDRLPDQLQNFMAYPGPRFVILPTNAARSAYPNIPAGWKVYSARGFNFAKGTSIDLTMLLKPKE
jgi:hypothetical protein